MKQSTLRHLSPNNVILPCKRAGSSFTKGRKFCLRRRRKRRLYVRVCVCVDCALPKVVTTHVIVDTHVDFVVVYV